MYQQKRIAVIIAAAGSGSRMGSGVSKQFLKIGDEMVVEKAIDVFSRHPYIDDIVLVVKKEDMEFCRVELIDKKKIPKLKAIVSGGKERQDSVYHALNMIADFPKKEWKTKEGKALPPWPGADYVLVHDGARPMVSADAIRRLVEATIEYKAAALGVPVKDTIKRVGGQWLEETLDRSSLSSIQTPQGFERELLIAAHKKAKEEGFTGTDDAGLVERLGEKVYLVRGEYTNIKITTKEDLELIQRTQLREPAAAEPKEWRTGTGLDVHAFAQNRPLILGGVRIPYEKGLLGHSDADVLVHAIMDALLGACGLGDIGLHFPDTEEQYRGIDSMKLLVHVNGLLQVSGYRISNIDSTVIGEKPKIAPYVKQMKSNLADALNLDETKINIKGTTTEKLGFCGREEGLAAMATVALYRE